MLYALCSLPLPFHPYRQVRQSHRLQITQVWLYVCVPSHMLCWLQETWKTPNASILFSVLEYTIIVSSTGVDIEWNFDLPAVVKRKKFSMSASAWGVFIQHFVKQSVYMPANLHLVKHIQVSHLLIDCRTLLATLQQPRWNKKSTPPCLF